MAPIRWGDEDDDSSVEDGAGGSSDHKQSGISTATTSTGVAIPPPHTSRVDSKGIQTVTTYRGDPSNPNRILKTTTRVRIYKYQARESKEVEKRRHWKRFALDEGEDESNVTIQSRDDVMIEDPNNDIDGHDENAAGKALAGNLNAFWLKQQRRTLERKYDVNVDEPGSGGGGEAANDGEGGGGGWTKVGGGGGATGGGLGGGGAGDGKGGKYVPPSQRGKPLGGGAGAGDSHGNSGGNANNNNRDQNTIRVTNISEDTTEADLQELFQPFGRISRVYLAKDKETFQSRGFAFVSYVHRDDAARAMERLQGYGYDHLILKLEWARPSAPRGDPGSEGTVFRSGYGKALAQDTKEKVSYASNLTNNA